MTIKVYTLNAFAKSSDWGNPAWVVLDANILSDLQMQEIAKRVWYSETAFIQESDKADFKLRFFTPLGEVDLCGHATIATFYLMAELDLLQPWIYTQETKSGILNIEIRTDHLVFMNQNLPQYFQEIDSAEIANSLDISLEEIMPTLPIQIVSTWLRDILIPIKNLETLMKIKPDFEKVKSISSKYDVIGYHLFTLESLYGSTAHCRNLAPLYDIPEESATWTSNWGLSCYLKS